MIKIRSCPWLCFALICILSVLSTFFSVAGAAERILNFNSDITVHHDASMTVKETINVRSEGQNIRHGVYRDFPVRYKDKLGNRYVLGFTVLDVLRDGNSEPYHVDDISNGKRVYIGDKNTLVPPGEYTYTLVYKTTRQLGFFSDHDELYWNVTGNGWEFPIENASASVRLPGNASKNIISMDGYTGPQGAKGKDFKQSFDHLGDAIFTATRSLNPYEGLTIVVSWPKGFVVEPDTGTKFRYFVSDNKGVLKGLVGLAVIFIYYLMVWVKVGRDPKHGVIVTRYTPPDKMTPAVMRYITNMGYDDKVFASAILNMAVKGFLKINEEDGEYTLERKDRENPPLAPEEERIVKKLMDSGKEVILKKANRLKIRSAIEGLRNYLSLTYEKIYFVTNIRYFVTGLVLTLLIIVLSGLWEATAKGRLPFFLFICLWLSLWSLGVLALLSEVISRWKSVIQNRRSKVLNTGGAVFMTFFSIPFLAGEAFGLFILGYSTSITIIVFLLLSIFINYLFYHLLKAPTRAGKKILDMIEGFKVFLVATEKDRLKMRNPPERTPELFEKYLSYALALDVEQKWAEQFADVLSYVAAGEGKGYTPVWYSGTALSLMSAREFASSFSTSLSDAISSSSTAPGSSSGGGGGSSGGGGGGGGGGGW